MPTSALQGGHKCQQINLLARRTRAEETNPAGVDLHGSQYSTVFQQKRLIHRYKPAGMTKAIVVCMCCESIIQKHKYCSTVYADGTV